MLLFNMETVSLYIKWSIFDKYINKICISSGK